MGIAERMQHWMAIRRVQPVEESPAVAGGRQAESLVAELAEAYFRHPDAYLLAGRRSPSKRFGRRREVDLIVCTPQRIHIIEVKNWAGQFAAEDGVWRQTRRGGDVLEHANPIEKNLDKRDVIVACLAETGTWDHLHLYGTRILAGDLVSLRIGHNTYRRNDLLRMTGGKPIRLKWPRGQVTGWLKAVTGLGSLGQAYVGNQRHAQIREQAAQEFPPAKQKRHQPVRTGVPARLRQERKAQGLTYYAVAKRAGIPNPNTVKDVEYGRDARLSNIEAIAKALGLKLELVRAS